MPRLLVWDRPVRVLHWALALACTGAWLTTGIVTGWHESLGLAALAIVAARIAWGFAGSRYARFSQFLRTPRATWAYAREAWRGAAPRYLGHNPLGGWMAIVLWACVAACGLSGWLYTTDSFWGEAWLDRLHEVLGWTLLALVPLHVAGVVHTGRKHGEMLVRAMLSGFKRGAGRDDVA